jgi:Domain of unknown function (DUF4845)
MYRVLLSGQRPRFLPAGSREATHAPLPRPKARCSQSTRARQRGVTAIGWLVLLLPFAIVIYAGIRLAPIYLNYMDVARTLSQLQDEFRSGGATPDSIRNSIEKHFEIDEVDYPTIKDISISRSGAGWRVEAAYDDQAPLFAGITLQVQFDKIVTLNTGD